MSRQYHCKRILSRKEFELSLQGHAKPVHKFRKPPRIAAAGEKSASISAICGQKTRPVAPPNAPVGRINLPVVPANRPGEPPSPAVARPNGPGASVNRAVGQRNAHVVYRNRHVGVPSRPVVSKNRPVGPLNRPVGQLNATFSGVYDGFRKPLTKTATKVFSVYQKSIGSPSRIQSFPHRVGGRESQSCWSPVLPTADVGHPSAPSMQSATSSAVTGWRTA